MGKGDKRTFKEIHLHQQLEDIMKNLASGIDRVLRGCFEDMGFMLICFRLSLPGVASYISNGSRDDMIKALRETADILEAQEDIPKGPDDSTIIQ